jgi:hypothetical protein
VNLSRNPWVSVVIDGGIAYGELRGAEVTGSTEQVGDVPRTSTPNKVLELPERLFADKYSNGVFRPDGRHAWLRLVPETIVSWDFRKITG